MAVLDDFESALFVSGLTKRSIETRCYAIRHLQDEIPDFLQATAEELSAYLTRHRWKPNYRRSIRSSLVRFYSWAYETGLIATNPARALPKFPMPRTTALAVPTDVMLEGFETANLHEKAIIALAATEGLRRSEIAALHPRDRHGSVLIVIGKGSKARKVPLNKDTYDLLVEIEASQGIRSYYFPGKTGPHTHLHPATIYKWWRRSIGNWALHSGRHRTASEALRETKNLRVVQELLGHSSLSTTEIYLHVDEQELTTAVESTSIAHAKALKNHLPPEERVITIDLDNITENELFLILESAAQAHRTKRGE